MEEKAVRYDSQTLSDYDLQAILNNKNNYTLEQLEDIFSNKENIITILKGGYISFAYKELLNLNIPKLNQIYMSDEVLTFFSKKRRFWRTLS